ncbi:MAG TPA: right-handed parallel beta-helix repeat-containing protein [Nevskiaceae bacterium]|nr:right-handed parallel beta-helix repeat-containing protein [Nevskiaceae bacterium]
MMTKNTITRTLGHGGARSIGKACAGLSVVALLLAAVPVTSASAASVIRVPADQPTIQQAIDAAANGDTVRVSSGTYTENINFHGKAITVKSQNGPQTTIIDGNQAGSVVTFATSETLSSVLKGFTVRNGTGILPFPGFAGGIDITEASPSIIGNIITNNQGCFTGGGIGGHFSNAPLVQDNVITNNTKNAVCSSGGGGLSGVGGQILHNTITNNAAKDGGGITLGAVAVVKNNTITGNTAEDLGGGMTTYNSSSSLVVQNLIANNTAPQGGGVHWSGSDGPLFLNNTIVNNHANQGSGIYAESDAFITLTNNIIVAAQGGEAINCGNSVTGLTLNHNNIFSSGGIAYAGNCISQTGINGNISANPKFVNAGNGNYHLKSNSPSKDAGDKTAPGLPAKDFDGDNRVIHHKVDQGIDEVTQN